MRVGALSMLAAAILSASAGCGSSDGSDGASTGGAGAASGAAPGNGGGIGVSLGGTGAGSGGDIDACAETSQSGELVPLDLYVMLDVSSSMLDVTSTAAAAPTKWDAVKRALRSFIADPSSAGLGVGIQYFPLPDPSVPESCTTDAQCGTHGPCFTRFCRGAAGFFACSSAADCTNASGQNLGPCAPLTYCYPSTAQIALCHDATECGTGQQCVPFNECSADTSYSCPTAGAMCVNSSGQNLGACRAFTPKSFCVHSSLCAASGYAAPAVDIQALPAAAPALVMSIDAALPDGNTPTAPALAGAIDKATSWAAAHVGHRVVVLLATDGLPTDCIANPATDPTGILGVRNTALAGVSGSPSVSTFVIGVFGPDDAGARANLNTIASAGGTMSAFMVDTSQDVTAQFLAALNAIRGSQLACEYQLPAPAAGSELDFSRVNVDFSNGGTKERLLAVANAAACDAATGGWYYDVSPSTGAKPTKIMICPASCSRFQATQAGGVQIALGCRSQVR